MAKQFFELDIWQKGHELLMEIYAITVSFPPEEKFSLVSQLIRSAISIIANIAEAHGRYYYADKIRVLYIARGELEETQSHLRIALARNYISQRDFNHLNKEYEGLSVGINKYINYLMDRKNNSADSLDSLD